MKNNIVRVPTVDGLYLHGFFAPNDNTETVLLHIHGFEGNFYENAFVQAMGQELESQKISFLVVNTRGNGRDTSFNTTSQKEVKVGARYELLEDAYKDIDAWVNFLLQHKYKKIILSGHSLGCYKVVRYLFEGINKEKISKLIIMSPFDKRSLIENYTKKPLEETLQIAEQMVKNGHGNELIDRDLDEIVVCYSTYCSWYKQDDYGKIFEFTKKDYSSPILKKIMIPTKIIVGSQDEYFYTSNPDHPEEAMEILLKCIPQSEGKIINGSVHSYFPHEDILAKEVYSFI